MIALLIAAALAGGDYVSEIKVAYEDLKEKVQPDDRPFQLYLTTFNLASRDAKRLDSVIEFVLNSLSMRLKLVDVARISPTLIRFDIRDLDWDIATVNGRVPFNYHPYFFGAFENKLIPYPALKEISPQLHGFFVARADEFCVVMLRDPVYRDILRLGKNVAELEKRLGYVAQVGISAERGGIMFRSGVAKHNRKVTSKKTPFGAYYFSTDMAQNNGKSSILANVLEQQEFIGGEIIFSLPNGLHGYAVYNNKLELIDKVPANVARDTRRQVPIEDFRDARNERPTYDVEILNGVSCFSCHCNGFILYDDAMTRLRTNGALDLNTFKRSDKQRLEEFFDQGEHHRQMLDDNARFRRVVERITAGFGEKNGPLSPRECATRLLSADYDYVDRLVTLEQAAADFGMQPERFVAVMRSYDLAVAAKFIQERNIQVDVQVADALLKALVAGEGIDREAWQKNAYQLAAVVFYGVSK